MKKLQILTIILLLIVPLSVSAVPSDPASIFGTVTLDGTAVTGGTSITITAGSGVIQTITTSDSNFETNLYSNYSTGAQQQADTFTFSISSYSGYDSVTSLSATFAAPYWGKLTPYNLAFTGTATAAAEETSSPSGSRGVVSSTPTESLTPVTSESVISEVSDTLPADWVNVEVEEVGEAKTETITIVDIDTALSFATETDSISELQQIKNAIENQEVVKVTVSKTLHVYKASNLDTGASLYRSKVTLTLTVPRDMENVRIVEIVPKNVAQSSDDLTFSGEIPRIVQKDPIVEWFFTKLSKGETRDLSYIVNKRLTQISSTTLSVGETVEEVVEEPPVVEEQKEPFLFSAEAWVGIMIVVFIILVGLIVYYIYTKPQTEKKEVKTKK